jgi:hypothetical protein
VLAIPISRFSIEWIAVQPRSYAEVMEAWRTSCPRLSIWEDACLDGLVEYETGTGKVILSDVGKAFLSRPKEAELLESAQVP